MGAIADAMMAYIEPLLNDSDGSIEQLKKALSIGQACWNLAITPEDKRRSAIAGLRDCFEMSDAKFEDFERSILLPMIRRHEEMFPALHQRSALQSPHWDSAFPPDRQPNGRRTEFFRQDSQPSPPLDLDEALRVLDEARFEFPEAAIRACQANRELAIPRLIDVLERTVRFGQDGATPLGNATIYALYLLAEFQATEAIPTIWRLLKLPHDIPDQLLGDSITEDLPRILAIFAGPRLDMLDELIVDPAHNQWVRSAAIGACAYLVRDELLSRPDAVSWLRSCLAEAIRRRDVLITDSLICKLLDLNANEARAEMELAFQEGLVDETMVNLKNVHDGLRPDAPSECNRSPYHSPTAIADTVEEMRRWDWEDESLDEFESDGFNDDDHINDDWTLGHSGPSPFPLADEDFGARHSLTIRHEGSRVGRNEPCPCGSGKKYKKCCLKSNAI